MSNSVIKEAKFHHLMLVARASLASPRSSGAHGYLSATHLVAKKKDGFLEEDVLLVLNLRPASCSRCSTVQSL